MNKWIFDLQTNHSRCLTSDALLHTGEVSTVLGQNRSITYSPITNSNMSFLFDRSEWTFRNREYKFDTEPLNWSFKWIIKLLPKNGLARNNSIEFISQTSQAYMQALSFSTSKLKHFRSCLQSESSKISSHSGIENLYNSTFWIEQ
jgi:hypothetical protein